MYYHWGAENAGGGSLPATSVYVRAYSSFQPYCWNALSSQWWVGGDSCWTVIEQLQLAHPRRVTHLANTIGLCLHQGNISLLQTPIHISTSSCGASNYSKATTVLSTYLTTVQFSYPLIDSICPLLKLVRDLIITVEVDFWPPISVHYLKGVGSVCHIQSRCECY